MAKSNDTPDIAALKELGKNGKLWKAEILCQHGAETRRFSKVNMTEAQLSNFMENVWKKGVMLAVDPGHWIVIPPWKVLMFDVWRQQYYFET